MINDLPKSLVEDSRKLLQQGADYEEFFKKALKKFGVNSPADFKSDEEKKKFFDYVDKNFKGKSESVSVKEFYRGYLLDEGSLNYVYFDKSEANKFKKKVEPFVDSVEMERSIAGHFNVMVKGEKKDLKRATDIAIKMSEEIEPLGEAKKGKYKSKNQNKVLAQMKKILSREKKAKDGSGDDKRIDDFMKAYKKGFETEMYDDMEILTRRSLKDIDKIFSGMVNSQNEQDLAAILQKLDPDLYDMMFGF
tara:strand:+ start:1054 stop:1800 length:747 start_codon:yes stop_codon:yes gene_type:complete